MRIIFIASLDHSGSTVLEAFLSSFKNCLGVGESYNLFSSIINPDYDYQKHIQNKCSRQRQVYECQFWGNVIKTIKNEQLSKIEQCYEVLWRYATDFIGEDVTIIDSSEYIYTRLRQSIK